jgi:membrane-associated protease RseP (regulator of RpoE activity)
VLVETVLLYILGVVVLVVGVALSIGLHEVGHLIPAKLFKVRVGQYMIGFGPTVWSKKIGETEYGVKAIPLGGYISMAGMYPPEKAGQKPRSGFFRTMVQDARSASLDSVPKGAEDRVFYKLRPWKRIIIMLGGPTMNLLIAIGVFAIILCGIGTPTSSTTVSSVPACVTNATSQSTKCTPDDPKSPAELAGLKSGDTVVSIDGRPISTWAQESAAIQSLSGKTVPIVIDRDGTRMTLTATPTPNKNYVLDKNGKTVLDAKGDPVVKEVGYLGILPATKYVPQAASTVLPTVFSTVGADFRIIGTLPQRLVQVGQAAFGTEARDPNGPIGVVGVGRLAGEAATLDQPGIDRIALLLSIIASLNLALFAFNLIPLLPLDGGHVLGAVWEGIRRTFAKIFKRRDPGPVDIAKLVPLTFAVVIVLGAMSLLLVYADIVKPITLQ